MNAITRVSAKGQVVIPKDVRDRLNWAQGTELEVIDGSMGVMLRVRPEKKGKMSFEESIARLQAIANYKGPKITDEMAKEAIDEMFRTDPKWGPPVEK